MIDAQGFRPNVGIVIANDHGQLLWARRVGGRDAWQFPQGGMMPGESPEDTLFRELEEETGLLREHVSVLATTEGWLTYRLPRRFLRPPRNRPVCIGQRQKWFLLRLDAEDEAIDLGRSPAPEFQDWRWVNYWYPIRKVVHFKRGVYARALRELAPALRGRR